VRPGVLPDVELEEVDPVQAEVAQALLGILADVVGREAVVERESPPRRPGKFLGGSLVATTKSLPGCSRKKSKKKGKYGKESK